MKSFDMKVRLGPQVCTVIQAFYHLVFFYQMLAQIVHDFTPGDDTYKSSCIVNDRYEVLDRSGGKQIFHVGIGFDRLLMYITGVANIRDTEPYPRTFGNLKY